MLHWICPECGRDCSPAVRECPACSAAAQKTAAPEEDCIDSVVRPLVESAAGVAATDASSLRTVAECADTTCVATPSVSAGALQVEPSARASREPDAADAAVTPVAMSTAEASSDPVVEQPAAAGETVEEENPIATLAECAPTEAARGVGDEASQIAPVEAASQPVESAETASEASAVPVESTTLASPTEGAEKECLDATAESPTAAPGELSVSDEAPPVAPLIECGETPTEASEEFSESATLASPAQAAEEECLGVIAEPAAVAAATLSVSEDSPPIAQPAEAVETPTEESSEARCAEAPALTLEPDAPATPNVSEGTPPASSPTPLAEETVLAAAELAQALELDAETLLEASARQVEADDAGVRAVASSFSDRPKTSLLAAPSEIVLAPAPPDLQCIRTTRPFILASEPGDPDRSALTSGPLTSTLAGPCLPRELVTFVEQPPAVQKRLRKSASMPTWIISLVVATALFLGAGSLLQYLTSAKETKGAALPAQPAAPSVAAASEPVSAETHPFARFVEVTGLRVIADSSHKPQVQYLVVNHSSSHISGVLLKIVVTPSEPSGAAALFTLSSVIPSLGPYQSKEIRTDLDAELRSSSIPDWQYLRTDVQVSSQQ